MTSSILRLRVFPLQCQWKRLPEQSYAVSQKEVIMDGGRRATIAFGVMLILIGVFFLVLRFVPGLQQWFDQYFLWPLAIVGFATLLLLIGLLAGIPAMVVPACIFGGIGGLLYWQSATGNWDSWAYAWALIPGFVGVGLFLLGLTSKKERKNIGAGIWMMFISGVMFLVFGSLFGAFAGGWRLLASYWPVLLIFFGALSLVEALMRFRR
jgi:hypothetical protein